MDGTQQGWKFNCGGFTTAGPPLGLSRLLQLRFKPLGLRRYLLYLLFLLHVLAACSTKQSMELEVRGKYAFLGQKAVIVLG